MALQPGSRSLFGENYTRSLDRPLLTLLIYRDKKGAMPTKYHWSCCSKVTLTLWTPTENDADCLTPFWSKSQGFIQATHKRPLLDWPPWFWTPSYASTAINVLPHYSPPRQFNRFLTEAADSVVRNLITTEDGSNTAMFFVHCTITLYVSNPPPSTGRGYNL